MVHNVTVWPTGDSAFDGFDFGSPRLIKGRWEYKNELFRTPQGEEVISRAIVYLTEDVEIGDFIAQGDYTETADPTSLGSIADRVRQFNKTTDLRGLHVVRKVML